MKECDYISLHVPLLEDTKGMINREKISMMKVVEAPRCGMAITCFIFADF